MSSIDQICLTHLGHETIGGLPGMILTASDVLQQATEHAKQAAMGAKKQQQKEKKGTNNNGTNDMSPTQPGLKLLGPEGTHKFFRSLRHFMRRDSFRVDIKEGISFQMNSDCNPTQAKRSKKIGKDSSMAENFQVQSIVAYTSLNADTSAIMSTPPDLERAIPPSKKRPRMGKRGGDITTREETGTSSGRISQQLLPNHASRQILSFLFTTAPIQGRFLIEKAQELGVPRGPLYGQLKAGKAVTFPSPTDKSTNVTVQSHQVTEPGSPGVVVAVLSYPSLDVLDQIKNSDAILQFQSQTDEIATCKESKVDPTSEIDHSKKKDGNKKPILELVIHMTTQDIFESDTCSNWRTSFFQNSMRHMFLRTEKMSEKSRIDSGMATVSVFQSAHSGSHLRSNLSPNVYRSLVSEKFSEEKKKGKESEGSSSASFVSAVPLLEYVLLPRSKRGFRNHDAFSQKWKTMQEEARLLVERSGCVDRAKQILDATNLSASPAESVNGHSSSSKIGAEILFTGTGSAIPCKHRNVSGIYVRMENGNAMLLDVGEGTVGQLLRAKQHQKYRVSGEDTVVCVLNKIKAVWISHPHADHHLGIIRLLQERKRLVSEEEEADPLVLIAPPNILGFLQEYEMIYPEITDSYLFLDCRAIKYKNDNERIHRDLSPSDEVALERLHRHLGIHSCTSIPVAHCAHSFAVFFHGTSFGSLAYSGDCRPSKTFSRVAYNADLLIHEATFADGMEADAVVKRHCTVGEALTVGKDMNAKTIILTHFSQRYPKLPELKNEEQANTGLTSDVDSSAVSSMRVIHAFDFMTVTPSNIPLASELTPALQLLYPDEVSEDGKETRDAELSDARAALEVPGLFAQKELL